MDIIETTTAKEFPKDRNRLRRLIRRSIARDELGGDMPLIKTEWEAKTFYCYSYLCSIERLALLQNLEELTCVRNGGAFRGPQVKPAHWVLRFVEMSEGTLAVPANMSRIAHELELAKRWNVSEPLVLGFLSEVGNQTVELRYYCTRTKPEAADRYKRVAKPRITIITGGIDGQW